MNKNEQKKAIELLQSFTDNHERIAFINDCRACSICHEYTGEDFSNLDSHEKNCIYRESMEFLIQQKEKQWITA